MYYKDPFLFCMFFHMTILIQIYNCGIFFGLSNCPGAQKKDTWRQLQVWQHSSQTSRSTWQSDLAGHQKMFCQRMRRGKEQHPPAPDRTEKQEGFFFFFFKVDKQCVITCFHLCVFIWMVLYTDGEQVVKSSQGVLSAVPQLQAEEKHLPTCPQLHRPIHHRSFNTFFTTKHWHLLQFCFLFCFFNLTLKQRPRYLPVVSRCTLGIVWPARRAAREVFPTPALPEMKIL